MEHCQICGTALMTSIYCKLHGGAVCQHHCRSCEHFDALTWHCLYYLIVLKPQEQAAAKDRLARQVRQELEDLLDRLQADSERLDKFSSRKRNEQ